MKIFDPHIHMTSRTTDDYEAMAAGRHRRDRRAGVLARPAAHPRRHLRGLLRWRSSAGSASAPASSASATSARWRSTRRRRTTRRVADGRARAPAALPREGRRRRGRRDRLRRPDAGRGASCFAAQLELAREVRSAGARPHAAPRQEARHRADASRSSASVGFPEERVLIDHNNEETLPLVLDTGCWAGHSIYPHTKMDEPRMVALVKKYGAERIIVNSAADWGVSDPLKVPKTVARDARERASPRPTSRPIVWDNPVAFFAQSGRLDRGDARARRRHRPARSCSRATRSCAARRRRVDARPRDSRAPHRSSSNVVGLDAGASLGDAHARTSRALAREGAMRPLATDHCRPSPARCSRRSSPGSLPREHGIVGNGWYFRDLAEVWFWRQSNRLVAGEKIWDAARRRDPALHLRQALLVVQHVQHAPTSSVTPRPMYPADGRKLPDVYTQPAELRDELQREARASSRSSSFWGPSADIASSRWIADCARHVYDDTRPTLTLVYLPHLDYDLQRLGPERPARSRDDLARGRRGLRRADRRTSRRDGARVVVLSEYGITAGRRRGPHQPRAPRGRAARGPRRARPRACSTPARREAFAVADHQVAHVYVRRPERVAGGAARCCEALAGVERVLDARGQARRGPRPPALGRARGRSPRRPLVHLLLLARRRARARLRAHRRHPPQARLRPGRAVPRPRPLACRRRASGWRLAKKALGFRYLMDVIPLDASLVQGSHGRPHRRPRGRARLHLQRARAAARRPRRRHGGQGADPRPRVRTLNRPGRPS